LLFSHGSFCSNKVEYKIIISAIGDLMSSTRVIFDKLPPLTRVTQTSFAKHREDSEGGHSVNRPTSISGVADDSRSTEDSFLHLKIKNPTFMPKPKSTLTLHEKEQLRMKFVWIKQLFHNYIEMLRKQGVDVSGYFVSLQNDRISYNIPNPEHRSRFTAIMNTATFRQVDIRENEPARRRGMGM